MSKKIVVTVCVLTILATPPAVSFIKFRQDAIKKHKRYVKALQIASANIIDRIENENFFPSTDELLEALEFEIIAAHYTIGLA